jgi:hypothetical protein
VAFFADVRSGIRSTMNAFSSLAAARVAVRVRALISLFAVGAMLLSATPAAAQTERDRATARRLAGEAMDLFEAGDFSTALGKFREADALVPAPSLKIRVARTLDKLDRMLEAAAVYREIIATELAPSDPPPHHEARRQAVPELAALLEQLPTVLLIVEGEGEARAEVEPRGEARRPIPIGERSELDPGWYTFAARIGELERVKSLRIERGANARVTLNMSPEAAEVARPSAPGAPDRTPWLAGGGTTLALGGAALIAGAITGGLVLARHADLEARCPAGQCQPPDHADARSFNDLRVASTVLLAVGAAAAATGTLVLALAPEAENTGALSLRPAVGFGTFALEGRFR